MIDQKRVRTNVNFTNLYPAMYPGKTMRSVTFIVTHECNLRCSYCYEHNKSNKHMTFEIAKKCVDSLFEADATDNPYINKDITDGIILDFIGGEPLIMIELIDKTVDYFRKRAIELNHRWATRYMISMSTNGVLYFDKRVQDFIEKNKGRLSIGVTVDGDKETHDSCRVDCNGCGSYDKASAAFESSIESGFSGTKFTIAPENVSNMFRACKDIIEKFDVQIFHCNCVYEEGWNDELAGILYNQLKQFADWVIDSGRYKTISLSIFDDYIGRPMNENEKQNWCGGTGKMTAFDVDGVIYPCLRYAPLSIGNRDPLRIGDVENGIGILEEDSKTIDMLNAITRQSQSSEECINCPIAFGCGWCSAYNYETYGTPNKRTTFTCSTHKARCLATAYYYNRIRQIDNTARKFPLNAPREWVIPIIGEEEYNMLVELSI